ncbi:MAG TPA: ADP-ribosylglycohydrolase family protein [Patescibacteria group bacterium]|nr:ADP-ribosylglycohydrolase family protein [Patescibacteria group bacterium]
MQKNKDDILNKYKGCLIGLALGDVLGVPFEFWKKENVAKYLDSHELETKYFSYGDINFPAGFYSDDTAMTICLAKSLIEKGFNLDDQFERYQKWYLFGYATPFDDRSYGIGQQTLKALSRKIDFKKMNGMDERAGGNGSLMRCAPIGLYYHGYTQEIKDNSLLASYITHDYHISGWTCIILNTILSFIIDGYDKKQIFSEIKDLYKDTAPNEIIKIFEIDYNSMKEFNHNISGYSVDTLKIALWSWLTSENYLESIKKVILLGDDADTFGAVTGAITGCYWGYDLIPAEYKLPIIKHDYIVNLAEKLHEKSSQIKGN